MANRHNMSFFGQKTGILFDSGKLEEPCIWLRFIKKVGDAWEKPSNNGGKAVKMSIAEIIAIVGIFGAKSDAVWKTMHDNKSSKTSIAVEMKGNKVSFSAGDYMKQFAYPETELFRRLLVHVLDEKIANATVNAPQTKTAKTESPAPDQSEMSEDDMAAEYENQPPDIES